MMNNVFLLSVLLFTQLAVSAEEKNLSGPFSLQKSKIGYTVKYLIKSAEGESIGAKGKGECLKDCHFIVAAPIKSFISKDSNRDLNMLKVVNADKNPLAKADIKFPSKMVNGEKLIADLEIEFNGIKSMYSNISFEYKELPTKNGFHVEGHLDLLLGSHKVERPSLMGVSIEDIVKLDLSADFIRD